MADVNELHRTVKSQLEELRRLIDEPKYLALFDEFLDEHEFGLALENLCDFLLESRTAMIGDPVLAQIGRLHDLMGVTDSCVDDLRQKARQSQ